MRAACAAAQPSNKLHEERERHAFTGLQFACILVVLRLEAEVLALDVLGEGMQALANEDAGRADTIHDHTKQHGPDQATNGQQRQRVGGQSEIEGLVHFCLVSCCLEVVVVFFTIRAPGANTMSAFGFGSLTV